MKRLFADAQYWVALLSDKDQSRLDAQLLSRTLAGTEVVTTEEVLTEVLAFFADKGIRVRQMAAAYVESLLGDPDVTVVPQSHQSFLDGLAHYQSRPDKGYSLTDCISMRTMRNKKIVEILTHDHHFTQEGFTILL
ncbi:MAG: PIN domain-containing protein [Isosphaeraceae bacterium]